MQPLMLALHWTMLHTMELLWTRCNALILDVYTYQVDLVGFSISCVFDAVGSALAI